MTLHHPPAWTCATCAGEVRSTPTFHVGVAFCCAGCVAGGPCTCSYDEPPEDAVEACESFRPEPFRPTLGAPSREPRRTEVLVGD